jgi:adenosine deaminase
MTTHIPKVELHCHFEGTISPDLMKRLAARNKMPVPENLIGSDGTYHWNTFIEFLGAYDGVSSVLKTKQDYRDIAYEYLIKSASEGCIYSELFTSPDHSALVGIGYDEMNEGIAQGIDDAEKECGIIGRMIATCIRHLGPEAALRVAQLVVDYPHKYVVGFGMGGDEGQYEPHDFAPAFDLVFAAGLPCTVHAGEVGGWQSVEDALDALPVTRIGHGVRSIENLELLKRLKQEKIVLEVCPTSNLALGIYKNAEQHPLCALIEAGCKVTLSSDDPPFFHTSIGAEYARAQAEFGLDNAALFQLTRNAIDAAFVDVDTKTKLRAQL